jgi:hypothetical protein
MQLAVADEHYLVHRRAAGHSPKTISHCQNNLVDLHS